MATGSSEIPLLPIKGVRVAACSAGLYSNTRLDIALIELNAGATCAAVFTRNSFCAAPIIIAREHLQKCQPRYCLINAGNANAGMGKRGYEDALGLCHQLSESAKCPTEAVLPFSTGVIGEPLPVDKISGVLPDLIENLADDSWFDVASAIMTTDTKPKGVSRKVKLAGHEVTITGIAKGSGMIRPDMATMLAYIATDAGIDREIMEEMLHYATAQSFNRISIDGDTSTNDACVFIATGQSSAPTIKEGNTDVAIQLRDALTDICTQLAKSIVQDGEGASKFVTININGGKTEDECRLVAYSIAHSPLVKTALFASDPNWGRILAAIGYAGIDNLDIEKISLYLDNVCVVANGERAKNYTESQGQAVMNKDKILINVNLNRGGSEATVWTCDLSHEYVRINAEYRT